MAFSVRTTVLLTAGTVIIDERAGQHRVKLEVDPEASLVYSRTFADGSIYQLVTDVRVYRHLPSVAVGLEWAPSAASLRLAESPQGLPTSPVLQARPVS